MDCSPSAFLSVEFFRQKYYIGLPSPSPGNLSNPVFAPRFPALQADPISFEPLEAQYSHGGDSGIEEVMMELTGGRTGEGTGSA